MAVSTSHDRGELPPSEPTWVRLETGGEALLAAPAQPRGVVVVHGELFGMTQLVTGALSRLSHAGWVALAPDLFWRESPRLAFGYDDSGRQAAFAALGRLDLELVTQDVRAAFSHVDPELPRHLMGFSTGGNLAVALSAEVPVTGVVAVYPGWLVRDDSPLPWPAPLTADHAGTAPVTIITGSDDHLVAPDLAEVTDTLRRRQVPHAIHVLPGVAHGFACPDRDGFDPAATESLWRLVLDALATPPGLPV